MVEYLFYKILKSIILTQWFIYNSNTKATFLTLGGLEEPPCIGKHQIGLETPTETDLNIVKENLEVIQLVDFDKMPSETILERSRHLVIIHLKYNGTVPSIKLNFDSFVSFKGNFYLTFLYFQWFEKVPQTLNYKNLTFPGELHALFYTEKVKDFQQALATNKSFVALAFAVEVNPLKPFNFDVVKENLKNIQEPFTEIPVANKNLKYWLNSKMENFYVYEGSLLEFYCRTLVLWIDFTDTVIMPPEVVKELQKLTDHQGTSIFKEFQEMSRPKGKIFTNHHPDPTPLPTYFPADENDNISSRQTEEIPSPSIVLVDGSKHFNSANVFKLMPISIYFLITFGHFKI